MENIVNGGEQYYHPSLRKDGLFEPVGSFTRRDAVVYFYRISCMPNVLRNMKRDIGAINYYLKCGWSIDLIMYTIDVLVNMCYDNDRPTDDLIKLGDYAREGQRALGVVKDTWNSYGLTANTQS